jgi:hypothetical protein
MSMNATWKVIMAPGENSLKVSWSAEMLGNGRVRCGERSGETYR